MKRIVDEVSLASVIDELVVDGEAVVHVVILAVTLLVDVELGHPVVRLVRHNITTAQHSCTRFFLKPLLPRPGAVALLQVLVGRLLVEPAAAGHGVDVPGGAVAGEHDGVEPLGGEHAAVRRPHVTRHPAQPAQRGQHRTGQHGHRNNIVVRSLVLDQLELGHYRWSYKSSLSEVSA